MIVGCKYLPKRRLQKGMNFETEEKALAWGLGLPQHTKKTAGFAMTLASSALGGLRSNLASLQEGQACSACGRTKQSPIFQNRLCSDYTHRIMIWSRIEYI